MLATTEALALQRSAFRPLLSHEGCEQVSELVIAQRAKAGSIKLKPHNVRVTQCRQQIVTRSTAKGCAAWGAKRRHCKERGGIDTYICKKTSPFGTRLFIKSAFIPPLSHEYSQYQRPKLNKGGLTAKKESLRCYSKALSLKKVPLYHHSPTNLRSTSGPS